jgi:hypothetical protein
MNLGGSAAERLLVAAQPGIRPRGPELGGPRLRSRPGEVNRFEESLRYSGRLTQLFTDQQRRVVYGSVQRGAISLRRLAEMAAGWQ